MGQKSALQFSENGAYSIAYRMIQGLQGLFEKYKELLHPGYKQRDPWREDILVDKRGENKDPRTVLGKPQSVRFPCNDHTVLTGIHTVTEDYPYVF